MMHKTVKLSSEIYAPQYKEAAINAVEDAIQQASSSLDIVWTERTASEKFVISASRYWVVALKAPKGSARLHRHINAWHRSFCMIGNISAAGIWDKFLGLIARHARREINFGCNCNRTLNMDENRLLACVSAVQYGDMAKAKTLLSYWLDMELTGLAIHHLILFADHLKKVSYLLPDYQHDAFDVFRFQKDENADCSTVVH